MASTWKALSFQILQKTVLLVSLSMLLYQDYLSLVEYQKHEYIQIPEVSTLAKVTLPMIVVCHEKPFTANVTSKMDLFMGASATVFVGWQNENITTKEHLKSLLLETHLNMTAISSERITQVEVWQPLEVHQLRLTYNDGQCFSVRLPKKKVGKKPHAALIVYLPGQWKTKISLYDPNTYNGYFSTAEPLPLDPGSYYQLFDVTLAETRQDPKDPLVSCIHFDEKHTFIECCSKKAEKNFSQLLGCVPPWFTDDQDKVCQMEDTKRLMSMDKATKHRFYQAMLGKFVAW